MSNSPPLPFPTSPVASPGGRATARDSGKTRPPRPALPNRRPARRGSILIVAMWVLISLVGLVLVLTRWARVESMAAANRVAGVQAATAARAGEQYVLSQVEQAAGDAITLAQSSAEQVPVGSAYFWILRPDREEDRQQDFAIDDEGSKININTAPRDVLAKLPGMDTDIADAIVDWRDTDSQVSNNGAENDYYQGLPQPYQCKNAPFETVEELLLVRGVTPELLYGWDVNHDGYLDDDEAAAAGGSVTPSQAGSPSPRGLLPFVTVQGVGTPATTTAATGTGTGGAGGQGGGAAQANPGLVNVNTAPAEVLRCLPGLEDADAASLVAARLGADVDTTSTAWVATTLSQQKAAAVNGSITAKSYRFSADIVGVSDDGRAFHRVRIVVDASKSPPAVLYRRDLTAAGWPLGQQLRAMLRSGMLVQGAGTAGALGSVAR